MTALDRMIQELARLQAPQRAAADSSPYAHVMQGVVTGVHLGGVDVLIRGQVNIVPRVPYLTTYKPGWGDNVWILRWGSDHFVLGDLVPTAVNEKIDKIEPWKEVGVGSNPAFLNSWVNYGAGWDTAAFAKQSDGWVRMKGLIKNGTINSNFFILPEEYRPPFLWGATVLANDVNQQITIQSNGAIIANAGTNAYISLNGATWPTVESWERERDTHWFSLMRSQNGWFGDSAVNGIDTFPQIYRRPDGWRYLKGNIIGGTATDHTAIWFGIVMPEDSTLYYERMTIHEQGVGFALMDVASDVGMYQRVIGGASGKLILVNANYWSRIGENLFSADPNYLNKSMQVWKEFSFLNGWVNYNTGSGPTSAWRKCQYFKDDFGVVHIRGLANGASKTSNIVTQLPVGYRPGGNQLFPTSVNGEVSGRLNVYPNGDVEIQSAPAGWASIVGTWKADL